MFQSTHSLRSATHLCIYAFSGNPVSIHALLAECDRSASAGLTSQGSFNPRTPCGVRHQGAILHYMYYAFQSTHSLRSATIPDTVYDTLVEVSIHALLAECDRLGNVDYLDAVVSIHALLAECDCSHCYPGCSRWMFQSTHSLRSATRKSDKLKASKGFQSTHSLRSATSNRKQAYLACQVSIHALLAECDHLCIYAFSGNPVSIHALLAECDK